MREKILEMSIHTIQKQYTKTNYKIIIHKDFKLPECPFKVVIGL